MLLFSSSNIALIIRTSCQNNFINITIEARCFTAMAKTGQFGADIFSCHRDYGNPKQQSHHRSQGNFLHALTTGFFCFVVIYLLPKAETADVHGCLIPSQMI